MRAFLQTVHEQNWGDLASLVGVAISLIGFAITIWGLARSKTAAEKTASAVSEVRSKLSLQSTTSELAGLMTDIEEVKLLHRAGAWSALPVRYSSIRSGLIKMLGSHRHLNNAQKSSI